MQACSCNQNESQGDACPIIREFRMSPEHRGDEYRAQLQARLSDLAAESGVDVPYRLQRLGVPADVILALRKTEERLALDWAKKFVLADRQVARFLVLSGPRGIGKSVAAGWVLAQGIRRYDWNAKPSGGKAREPFVWAKAVEVSAHTEFGRVNAEWLEGLKFARILVVDEMGHEDSAKSSTALRDVLIFRYERSAPTVLTGNMSPQQFKSRYGASWFDRMASAALMPDLGEEKSMRQRGGQR